ncbi:MAG: efflux RND transporter periplasmic adaptor subunit [Thermodesulfobacteriota bacterium]
MKPSQNQHQKRHLRILTIHLFCVLCATVLMVSSCGKKQQTNQNAVAVPVVTAQVIQKDAPYFLNAIGSVKAFQWVEVKPRVTGQLLEACFKEGEFLKKGQRIFTIDPAPFQAKLDEAEARLKQANTQLEQADRDLKRYQVLYEAAGISSEQYEAKQVDFMWKKYQVALEEAQVTSARLDLGYCSIEAPMDGLAGEIKVDDKNIVTAYQTTLVNVRQIQPIKVVFSLPGKFLQEIIEYNTRQTLEVRALFTGIDEPEIGSLNLIDNWINPKTGMIMLQGLFPNPKKRLWPGEFVKVLLQLTVTKDAVLVPSQAVMIGPKGKYVWRVKDNNTVEIRLVLISRSADGMEVVAEGLQPGDTVVAEGQTSLFPGAPVQERERPKKSAEAPRPEAATSKKSGPR